MSLCVLVRVCVCALVSQFVCVRSCVCSFVCVRALASQFVCVRACVPVRGPPYRQRVVPPAVGDLAADVLLRAVQPVVPVQVVGVDVRLGGGEAHAAGVALDAREELRHHALIAPVGEENPYRLEHIQGVPPKQGFESIKPRTREFSDSF